MIRQAFGQFQYPTPPLARPGGAQAKFLAEINELEEERNTGILTNVYRDFSAGSYHPVPAPAI